jgi:hypothetical protein
LQRKLAAVETKFGKSEFERRHYALLAVMCTYGTHRRVGNNDTPCWIFEAWDWIMSGGARIHTQRSRMA